MYYVSTYNIDRNPFVSKQWMEFLLGKNKSTNFEMNDFLRCIFGSFKIHLIILYSGLTKYSWQQYRYYWNISIHTKISILSSDVFFELDIYGKISVLENWVQTGNAKKSLEYFMSVLIYYHWVDFADIWYIFIRNLDVSLSNYFCSTAKHRQ